MNRWSKFPVFYMEQQELKLGSTWPPSLTEHQDKTGFLPAFKRVLGIVLWSNLSCIHMLTFMPNYNVCYLSAYLFIFEVFQRKVRSKQKELPIGGT